MIIWEGVYQKKEQVPKSDGQHDARAWVEAVRKSTMMCMGQYFIATSNYSELAKVGVINVLKLVRYHFKHIKYNKDAGVLLIEYIKLLKKIGKPLNILDIGGGMGLHYIMALENNQEDMIKNYIIAETEAVKQEGQKFYKSKEPPSFISDFPNIKLREEIDIVYCRNAIQYLDDYEDALHKIISFHPEFIIFERTPFVNCETYYTCQLNVGGEKIPCQMINYEGFKRTFEESGYRVKHEHFGEFDRYVENLPQECRPFTFANIVFEKVLK